MIRYNRILKMFLLLVLFSFILIACVNPHEPLKKRHNSLLGTTHESENYSFIHAVLKHEAEARKTNNQATLEKLFDPTSNADWIELQLQLSYPNLASIEAKRIEIVDERAIVNVVITQRDIGNNSTPLEYLYTIRILRNFGNDEWKLTIPNAEVWGDERIFTNDCLQIVYYEFDEPYVETVIPQLEPIYEQITKDFQIDFCEDTRLTLVIAPLGSRATDTYPMEAIVPSPSTVGFSLNLADSPEQFLLGIIIDYIGHSLVDHAYSNIEMGRKQLAHIAVQWEVEDATKRSFRQRRYQHFIETQKQLSLAMLLDPSLDASSGISSMQRNLVGDFIAETYGRSAFASFLKAVSVSNNPNELARAAFGESIDVVEIAWQQWLEQSNSDSTANIQSR